MVSIYFFKKIEVNVFVTEKWTHFNSISSVRYFLECPAIAKLFSVHIRAHMPGLIFFNLFIIMSAYFEVSQRGRKQVF